MTSTEAGMAGLAVDYSQFLPLARLKIVSSKMTMGG
jgi:hypothetical protein